MENQCRLLLQGFHTSQQPVTKLWSPFSGKPRSLDRSVAVSCVIPNCNRSFQRLVFSWLMIAQWLDDSSARLLPSCVERRSLHQPVPICTCGPPSGRPVAAVTSWAFSRHRSASAAPRRQCLHAYSEMHRSNIPAPRRVDVLVEGPAGCLSVCASSAMSSKGHKVVPTSPHPAAASVGHPSATVYAPP